MRLLLAVLLWPLLTSPALAGSIGLFSDTGCSSCNLTIPVGGVGTFYIAYVPSNQERILGAEFQVVGLPSEWLVLSVTPNPTSTIVLGNPMNGGTNTSCATTSGTDCLNLFTVQVQSTQDLTDVYLQVTRHTTPSRPNFQCPFVIYDCGDPCDSWGCVGGGQLFINSGGQCSVTVAASSWSQVKRLFE